DLSSLCEIRRAQVRRQFGYIRLNEPLPVQGALVELCSQYRCIFWRLSVTMCFADGPRRAASPFCSENLSPKSDHLEQSALRFRPRGRVWNLLPFPDVKLYRRRAMSASVVCASDPTWACLHAGCVTRKCSGHLVDCLDYAIGRSVLHHMTHAR